MHREYQKDDSWESSLSLLALLYLAGQLIRWALNGFRILG
jgi:hypothetical protein